MTDAEPARLTHASVRRIVGDVAFPPTCPSGTIGLEVELLPVVVDAAGRVGGRPSLARVRAAVAAATIRDATLAGIVSLEPGGQVEVSPAPARDVATAVAVAERATRGLAAGLAEHDIALLGLGLDPWHRPDVVPQQLDDDRYPAMAAALARRGPHGAEMMRCSCALQVNVDLGPVRQHGQRWRLAHLLGPLLTASFACSPGPGVVSARAGAWAGLDPTRTRLPRGLGSGAPVDDLVALALAADVLWVRGADGRPRATPRGWSFGQWLADGHPTVGRPTAAALREHLTTLFADVRARGFLELRSLDAVPARWRSVPAVLLDGVFEDDLARTTVLGFLERETARLERHRATAWRDGVRDPTLCALAVEAWSRARDGAARRGAPGGLLAVVDAFLDELTTRGRAPTDELSRLLADDPTGAAVVAWAREPLPRSRNGAPAGPARGAAARGATTSARPQ